MILIFTDFIFRRIFLLQFLCFQLNEWRWMLDNNLPSPFDKIADWLIKAENIIYNDDIPNVMNADTAKIISNKLEEHKVINDNHNDKNDN